MPISVSFWLVWCTAGESPDNLWTMNCCWFINLTFRMPLKRFWPIGEKIPVNVSYWYAYRFFTTVQNSYIQDIKLKQGVKEKSGILPEHYRYGQYLLLDANSKGVLVDSTDTPHRLKWASSKDLDLCGINVEESVFLTFINGIVKFAINVSTFPRKMLEETCNGNFISLRASLFKLETNDCFLVSQSHSLLDWEQKFKFCSACSGALIKTSCGQKICKSCDTTYYPTIDPVGISLVTDQAKSKALLVRQYNHPPKMFTCIAGFIETGESIEENVRREVAEEVGLQVTHIQYMGSQHWSLPASRLMIGCTAQVHDENFVIDTSELEAARWFSPEEIKQALASVDNSTKLLEQPDSLWVPPPGAIAHTLIQTWLKECCTTQQL